MAAADNAPGPGNRALIWDAADGKLLNTIVGPSNVNCLAFSPDSRKLAVGSADQQLRIFRTSDGLLLERCIVPAAPATVAFAPDNVTLAVAAGNSAVMLRCCLLRVLAGHQGDVTAVHYLPDGTSLLSSGADKTVRLWDAREGKPSAMLLTGSGAITGLALSRDGRRFVTADADHVARVWELDRLVGKGPGSRVGFSPPSTEGGLKPTLQLPAPPPLAAFVHAKAVRGVSISADGNRVATACEDGSSRVWDTTTGKELERTAASPGNPLCVAFNVDATAVVSGGANGAVSRSDCCVIRAVDAHRGPVRGLRFAADGSLFSAGEDKSLVEWAKGTWKVVQRFAPAAAPVRSMVLSPCGRFLAAADGPRVRLWDAAQGRLMATLETPAAVTSLALGEGGGKLLVAGADKIIRNYAILQAGGVVGTEAPCTHGRCAIGGKRHTACAYYISRGHVRLLAHAPDRAIAQGDQRAGLVARRQHALQFLRRQHGPATGSWPPGPSLGVGGPQRSDLQPAAGARRPLPGHRGRRPDRRASGTLPTANSSLRSPNRAGR